MSPVLAFSFWYLPSGLLFAFIAVLNYWVWRRSKSSGHLLMCLGSSWLAQYYVLSTFEMCLIGTSNYGLAVVIGSVLFAVGFYTSVKPLVAAEISQVRFWIGTRLGRPGRVTLRATPPPAQHPSASGVPFFSPPAGVTPLPPPTIVRFPTTAARTQDELTLR